VPTPSPNGSDAVVMMRDGAAMVAYGAITGGRDHIAGVRFDDCVQVVAGGPNDEALHQHRWFSLGLRHYTIQVCGDSPWARDGLCAAALRWAGRIPGDMASKEPALAYYGGAVHGTGTEGLFSCGDSNYYFLSTHYCIRSRIWRRCSR
jgi:hypothetical protein